VLALVIAWSADEPHRVGEIAVVPESSVDLVLERRSGYRTLVASRGSTGTAARDLVVFSGGGDGALEPESRVQ
jgi:hypothetical protein